ncbi:hypothetical protein ACPA54_26405 [Uniformispora flossi]|uniref:hypothetical protein n=1 Tax=Uniformispora flossi TaxID=3390723 RepID=UPI003C2BE76A
MPRHVSGFEPPADGWSVDRDDLLDRLARAWPRAVVDPIGDARPGGVRDATWTYAERDLAVEGWLQRPHNAIVLDGDDELVAQFAAWFRKLVPDEIEVVFADEGYWAHVILPPNVTPEDVMRLYADED